MRIPSHFYTEPSNGVFFSNSVFKFSKYLVASTTNNQDSAKGFTLVVEVISSTTCKIPTSTHFSRDARLSDLDCDHSFNMFWTDSIFSAKAFLLLDRNRIRSDSAWNVASS